MKKNLMNVVIVLLLSIISTRTQACHIDTLGWCKGQAYFETQLFNNHSIFEIRYYGDTSLIFSYITSDVGNTDTIFNLPQPSQDTAIQIQFRYKNIDSLYFNDWQTVQSGTNQFAGCSSLGVNFTSVTAKKTGSILQVTFGNDGESQVDHYNVELSADTKTWVVAKAIKPTGQHNYSLSINLALIGAFFLPLIALVTNQTKRLRKFVILFLLAGVIFLSCKKERAGSTQAVDYKFLRVEAVNQNGSTISSDVKTF